MFNTFSEYLGDIELLVNVYALLCLEKNYYPILIIYVTWFSASRMNVSQILEMINRLDTEHGNFSTTVIYNEDWMLRLVLNTHARDDV